MILFTILLIMLFVLLIASAITILIMGIGGIAFVLACSDIIICIYLEENKSSWDADDKYNRRIMDEKSNDKDDEIKQKQLEEQVKDRYFKVGIAAAELMICYIFP